MADAFEVDKRSVRRSVTHVASATIGDIFLPPNLKSLPRGTWQSLPPNLCNVEVCATYDNIISNFHPLPPYDSIILPVQRSDNIVIMAIHEVILCIVLKVLSLSLPCKPRSNIRRAIEYQID